MLELLEISLKNLYFPNIDGSEKTIATMMEPHK